MELPEKFQVRALLVARRIRLRRFPAESATAVSPMLFSQKEHGYIALFRYGVVVFINISPLEQQHLLDYILQSFLEEPIQTGEEESIEVMVAADQDERVLGERLTLHETSLPRLQILAEVMARSVLLADYET